MEVGHSDVEGGPTNNVSESSPWASVRDYLTPSDVLVLRTAGPKLEPREVVPVICRLVVLSHGKDGSGKHVSRPEWPSLRFDHRQIYVLDNGMFEPGELPDLTAPGSSGE